ncbi:MAG: hypothetical protein IPH44_14350 [Myxococcales bacterium]|nr:hypothetical protein [Myxococcales bacterium]MBK7193109.1 hypothetical protein [Myxococcales bacterium]
MTRAAGLLALLGLVACQAASAQQAPAPTALALAGVIAPAPGWQPLPAVATAATEAVGAAALAWGDPGRGCYAVVIGSRAVRQNPEDALAELGRGLAKVAGLTGWQIDGLDARGAVARGPLTGALRATAVAAGNDAVVVAAACVANAREPATCAAACQGVLAAFDARKVLP